MLAEERKCAIVDLVNSKRIVTVAELSKQFNTTEATIRRDLDDLENQHKIRRVYGGAASLSSTSRSLSNHELSTLCLEEKKRIAARAYDFIDDHDAILLDASTTVLELAKFIAQGNKQNLSILTNSFNVVDILRTKKDISVIHLGGQVHYSMNYAIGSITENMIRNIRVEKCFIGTNGIDETYGYSVPNFEDASVKKSMLKASKQKFVLADHTKFGDAYVGKFANFAGDVDYLIMDLLPNDIDSDTLQANVNLIIAK